MAFSLSARNLAPWSLGFSSSTFRSAIQAPWSLRLRACQLPCRWQYGLGPTINNAKLISTSNKEKSPSENAFIGREDDLTRLWASLRPQPSPTRQVAVVHGPDGVGKSQLAAHFSQLHENNFSSTWWVNGKDKDSALASLGALASRLPTDEATKSPGSGPDLEKQASIVLEWLSREENSKWLLVFDDVVAHQTDRTRSSDAYSIRDFFPRSDHGSILITTGGRDMPEAGESHVLKNLGPQESLEFLDTRAENNPAGQVEDQARDLLVRQLEGLPLALAHATSYIRQTGQSISSYVQLFQDTRQNLQATEHEYNSTMVTCALSVKEIQQSNPSAAKLLLLLSCYDNTRIPSGLLEHGHNNPALSERVANPPQPEGQFGKDLQTLSDFSLITILDTAGTYSMHPVVKNWCRNNMNATQQEELNTVAVISVGTAATRAFNKNKGSPRDRQSLLPHADEMRHILQNGGLLSSTEQTIPAIRSLGSLYEDQGLLAHAEDMYLRALSRSQDLLGFSHHLTKEITRDLRRLRYIGQLGKKYGTSWGAPLIVGMNAVNTFWDRLTIFFLVGILFWFVWMEWRRPRRSEKRTQPLEKRTEPSERKSIWERFGGIR